MKTQDVIEQFGDELFFFILKKVKDKEVANDVFQNTFLKIHEKRYQLKNEGKLKSWVFQIARNEMNNYFTSTTFYTDDFKEKETLLAEDFVHICCLDKMINQLPNTYQDAIKLAYIKGKKQNEIAEILHISNANVKARIRRGKAILKQNLHDCCQYEIDEKGRLRGESHCTKCDFN